MQLINILDTIWVSLKCIYMSYFSYYYIQKFYMVWFVILLFNNLFIMYYFYADFSDNLIIYFSYNCIYYYSKLQMGYTKINTYINCVKNKIVIPYDIEFIQNGKIIYKTYKKNIGLIKEMPPFDFIIYSDNTLYNDNHINKIIYYSIPKDFNYTKTNFKFIIVNLLQNNHNFQLNLSNNNYNYYIVNNVINDKFLLYFLNNIEKCKIQLTDYTLQIMDHNINEIEVLSNESLIFNNDDYIKK